MIRIPSTRLFALALFLGGVALAPLLDNSDTPLPAAREPLWAPTPEFHMTLGPGELTLAGHTVSQQHEKALTLAAKSAFPQHRLVTDFEALGIVPDFWAATTLRILNQLRSAHTADAVLSESMLRLRAIVADEHAWQEQLRTFEARLPTAVTLASSTMRAALDASAEAICERAFDGFSTGPVNFEESSTRFRSSAYPRLDRLADLARTCEASRIRITGHTDASGSEAWNQRLSLLRADAVRDYLVDQGISPDRIETRGAGSAEPLASNDNRYGRSLNRRIEIRFISDRD